MMCVFKSREMMTNGTESRLVVEKWIERGRVEREGLIQADAEERAWGSAAAGYCKHSCCLVVCFVRLCLIR